ncbi:MULTISPECIES: type VI secretion system-associated FHA domain protein TagH [Pseudomonas]|uniref:Type VI secretion system-associated FHA domain protein TagH n=1 Tax=Pseudomonas edaphica TaxID=2006980 RepID=A0A7Y8E1M7_9PSED|nr:MULTISPECIES: type VI secretion system-associated FHA domain protein TagH [Pseudomonas]MCF5228107.1 type VI secretion system-associated FHA domain protein TagH [Pseudomonas sp. PA-5-4H]MCF5234605.1 type VI secretion system-associated FHA domain protein TagH [Pseudomonas sp. PA-5-4G]MCF5245811.1 type VI secretion system-associated FHA domain protein TagH [Pseudomonas sp. PA-5-4B]MCF5251784.1 type VI secretion system-associated FHA domain protein TagH [Pseudomonas sp. PA-5-4B]MCF5257738.1 typ
MSLCLTITSYHKITPGQCPEKSMDQGVMAIGRNSDNDWVLPDPERLVSSQHCVIQYKDGRYYLTDNSTNGVELVNAGIRMRRGNSEPLQDGELIRIGDYEIQARIDFNVQALDSQPFSGDSPNSFEALMGAVANKPAPAPVIAPQFQGASSMDTLPDLFDFLTPTTVPPPTVADHVPSEQHDFRPPTPVAVPVVEQPVVSGSVIPEDWDLFGDTPAPVVAAPQPVAPPEPPAAPVVQPTAPAITQQPDLLQAFLRGAGLDQLRLDKAQAEAQMESIGRSYRLMVEGLIDVLRARASLKGEFRMQQTMIQPAENNPLKFAPNADEALLLLLRHGNQAFMAPDVAVRESFDDLRAHQLAVMAGVEAAIKHLLTRFEPAQLEERMGKPAGLSSLFNGSRQAQYWQQFTELYSNISREAQEDFQDLFGREFSRAYEEHSARQRR